LRYPKDSINNRNQQYKAATEVFSFSSCFIYSLTDQISSCRSRLLAMNALHIEDTLMMDIAASI
jgi:hypothetical protein